MRLEKVYRVILFVAFFLCLHFLLCFWAASIHLASATCNYGGPFGIILPWWLFVPVLFGVSVFLVVQWWKEDFFSREWLWLLILAGGLGNLLERLLFGCITDYIAFPPFPVFNIADVLLTIGVTGILWDWYFRRNKKG